MNQSKIPTLLSWSGGKDSALALYELQRGGTHEVVALLTSVAEEYDRISHHGVRAALLDRQAAAIGLPVHKVSLPSGSGRPCTNEVYEAVMEEALLRWKAKGVRTVAFGDIFLEDLRKYRERNLAKIDMQGVFPLWQRDTMELVRTWIGLGFRAYLSCVEGKLGEAFAGRSLDGDLLRDLPKGVDPCGENGEYHSFVYDGPVFRFPVSVDLGETIVRDGRFYTDLLPGAGEFSHAPAPDRSVASSPAEIPPVIR